MHYFDNNATIMHYIPQIYLSAGDVRAIHSMLENSDLMHNKSICVFRILQMLYEQ
jgi:hypothetical protein